MAYSTTPARKTMAEYKIVCIADQVPPNTTVIDLGTDCPGGSGWVLDTDWLEPLTYEQGAELTGAIMLVWIAGWGARQVIRVIRR
jgi:hypothetical protein